MFVLIIQGMTCQSELLSTLDSTLDADLVSPALQPRLFKATGARVLPQVEWVEIQVKSVLNRVQGMSFKWSINPYRGCSHGCKFCYARLTHWYLDQDGVNSWSSRIFVKINAPEVLRRELAHHSWTREEVHLGTATDPYQPTEGSYKISRQILEVLLAAQTPVNIVTRSTMVVRDVDLLTRLAGGPGAMVCFSIATMDAAVAREIEPDVPPPLRRLEALRSLAQAGVPVAVLLAPVIPGITDHPKQLAAVVMAAKDYGASSLWTNALHLGDVTRQAFFQYLGHRRPELIPEYERMYRGKYAPSAYRRHVQEVVAALKARHGLHNCSEARRRRDDAPAAHSPQQLFLF